MKSDRLFSLSCGSHIGFFMTPLVAVGLLSDAYLLFNLHNIRIMEEYLFWLCPFFFIILEAHRRVFSDRFQGRVNSWFSRYHCHEMIQTTSTRFRTRFVNAVVSVDNHYASSHKNHRISWDTMDRKMNVVEKQIKYKNILKWFTIHLDTFII